MRGILPVLAITVAAFGCAATNAFADATCNGNACGVVALSADGCQWTNKGDKSVRLSLVTDGVARLVTVLAPKEAYREPNKAFCTSDSGSYSATYAALSAAPEPEAPAKPVVAKAKPPAAVAPVASAPVVDTSVVASVTPTVPMPRAKPKLPSAYPPLPRAKPQAPLAVAAAEPAVAPATPPTVPQAAVSAPVGQGAVGNTAACADACPPILFKVFDGCLWVLNLNPRAVAFEADVGSAHTTLALEAADGAKADARAAALSAGTVMKDEGAFHMRLRDPFQSAGSGIPIYRAKLMVGGACVKSRDQIARFSANYMRW